MKQKIVFFGSGYYVIPIVEKLLKHNLLIVITTEIEGEFVNYLKTNSIPLSFSKFSRNINPLSCFSGVSATST